MIIGVPKEIKNHEYRVGLVPASVFELTQRGHTVYVETNAGGGIGIHDSEYEKVGAIILKSGKEVFEKSTMIVKIKEFQESEYSYIQSHHLLFTYLHLAANRKMADALTQSRCVALSYDTVTDTYGGLPLLAPMSAVAGRMAVQVGAHYLEKNPGGPGMLLGGVPGVAPGRVLVLGGGVAGEHAIRIALGMGAQVTVLDRSIKRLRELEQIFGSSLQTLYSTEHAVQEHIKEAHVVIGAVLVQGAAAPKLVTEAMVKTMIPGSVMVDISIDQGGCFETSHPTTHDDPVYQVHGVTHYCVANMPGAVARTSTFALNNATLPFVLALADHGLNALEQDPHLMNGLNVYKGSIAHKTVAQELGLTWQNELLAG